MNQEALFADVLVRAGIARTGFENPIRLTSGILSPIYLDCRELITQVEARNAVVDALVASLNSLPDRPDAVAGTATAGIPWASFVADRLELPMYYVRSKPKGHGAGRMVEGLVQEGLRIAVIEDAISTAGSAVQSVKALRSELDATVTDILAIFTWDTPLAHTNVEDVGCNLHALTKFEFIARSLHEQGVVDDAQLASLQDFHADPAGWEGRR